MPSRSITIELFAILNYQSPSIYIVLVQSDKPTSTDSHDYPRIHPCGAQFLKDSFSPTPRWFRDDFPTNPQLPPHVFPGSAQSLENRFWLLAALFLLACLEHRYAWTMHMPCYTADWTSYKEHWTYIDFVENYERSWWVSLFTYSYVVAPSWFFGTTTKKCRGFPGQGSVQLQILAVWSKSHIKNV